MSSGANAQTQAETNRPRGSPPQRISTNQTHLKSHFQGCGSCRKQRQRPLKIMNTEASGTQKLLNPEWVFWDVCWMDVTCTYRRERPKVLRFRSGLTALLNYCEEVVWQRRTRRRSEIRHLFVVRSLFLFCGENLALAERPRATEPHVNIGLCSTNTWWRLIDEIT